MASEFSENFNEVIENANMREEIKNPGVIISLDF